MLMHIFRIGGSVLAVLAVSVLSPNAFAATLKLGGTGADLGTMRQLAAEFKKLSPDTTIEIQASIGSSGGINAVVAGALDIGISSRPLKESERKQGAQEWAYAKTPLLFATHKDASQTELTTAEIIGIYAGTMTKWKDGTTVRLVLRPETDTDTLLIREYIPGVKDAMEKAYQRRGLPVATTDQDAADMTQKIAGAVGLGTLSLILGENRPLKVLALNNVEPSVENIGSGAYPLAKSLYLITKSRPKAEVQRFVDFIRSNRGATILRRTGHLVLNSKTK